MMLVLEGGDRRLVLAEQHGHGEGQRGRRGNFYTEVYDVIRSNETGLEKCL